jgi:hypothetical protein
VLAFLIGDDMVVANGEELIHFPRFQSSLMSLMAFRMGITIEALLTRALLTYSEVTEDGRHPENRITVHRKCGDIIIYDGHYREDEVETEDVGTVA